MDRLHVLVVDDEPGMRAAAARVLERTTYTLPEAEGGTFGYEVEQAESAEAALERISARAPDLLLLDYKLPGLSGLDLLEKLPALAPQVLTVMSTAYATLDTVVTATKRGAFDFVTKPFTPDELRAAVYKATRHIALARQARRHAEEKRRIRFDFISVLGHELKAPLAAMEGFLFAMKDHSLGPEIASYSPMIDRSIVRLDGMRKLVVDLLDMTRIESGQRRRELEPLDVVEVARGVVESLRPEAEKRAVTLSLRAGEPVCTVADRVEVEVVLTNLVTNAIKYNRQGGTAEVAVTARGGRVSVRVADTGIGMTAEESARLFQDFVRIKSQKTALIPGSGLGLSIVKKVATLYGGEARIESQPDVGTAVEVTLGAVS